MRPRPIAVLPLLALSLWLGACGFTPIYGDHGGGRADVASAMGGVFIENIGGQQGQFLRNKLTDRLYFKGRPEKPEAFLSVSLSSYEEDLGIQKDATATRGQLTMTARYRLKDGEGRELLSGTARSIVSYGKLAAQYGLLATQRGAYERALTELSEQIAGRLSLHYAEGHKPVEKSQ